VRYGNELPVRASASIGACSHITSASMYFSAAGSTTRTRR
jgi:hypothetical protein